MTGLPPGEALAFTFRYPGESADRPAARGTVGTDGGFLTGFLAQDCRFGTYSITLTAGSMTKRLSFEVVPDAVVDCSSGAPVVRGPLPTLTSTPTPSLSPGGRVVAAMEGQTSLKLRIVESGTSVLVPESTQDAANCTRDGAFLNCVINKTTSLVIQKPTGVRVTSVVDVPGLKHTFDDSFQGVPSILQAGLPVSPVGLVLSALYSPGSSVGAPTACAIGTCGVLRYQERSVSRGVDRSVVGTLLFDPATNLLRQADFITTYANGKVLTTSFTYSEYGVPNTIP